MGVVPPLALYLHLPWCVRKCPYCDFNSHTAGDAPPRSRYVDALKRDIEAEAALVQERPLVSVFIGGGTPSLFSGAELGEIMQAVRDQFAVADDLEVTMEANPGSVERHNLGGYREAGINRLSLGAQSFGADTLQRLGRVHSPADIAAAVRDARVAGFDNLNLDLMFALPGQDLALAATDLEQALALAPEHLSLYQLTLEPNTVFYARPPQDLPDDELSWDMQEQAFERLSAAGFNRYEISAFAVENRECRHNRNYWLFGDYLAAGAGAHGKLTGQDGVMRRYAKPAHPSSYMLAMETGDAPQHQPVGDADRLFEFMLNALRLPGGFDLADFVRRTGLSGDLLEHRMQPALQQGLAERRNDGGWRPTALGLRFLNDLQALFLPSAEGPA